MIRISLYLIIIFAYSPKLLVGQQNQSAGNINFVYLRADSLIPAQKVMFHSNIFQKNYITADSLKYFPNQVSFFQNDLGFYGNTHLFNQNNFVKRIDTGRVNLYASKANYRGFGGYQPSVTFTPNNIGYYNFGYDDIRKARLKFMKEDLKDNELSLKHIKDAKRLTYLTGGLFITGFSISGLGFLASWGEEAHPLLYIGTGLMASAIIPLSIKKKKKKKAFLVYNQMLNPD